LLGKFSNMLSSMTTMISNMAVKRSTSMNGLVTRKRSAR